MIISDPPKNILPLFLYLFQLYPVFPTLSSHITTSFHLMVDRWRYFCWSWQSPWSAAYPLRRPYHRTVAPLRQLQKIKTRAPSIWDSTDHTWACTASATRTDWAIRDSTTRCSLLWRPRSCSNEPNIEPAATSFEIL